MNIKSPFLYAVLGIAMFCSSCESDDITTDVSVFTEEIVFASGESAIMTGRVLAQGTTAVEDHGFQISTDENFTNPLIISLGEKDLPGRFVGEINQLDIRINYYCRAYITIKGETKTGNILDFSTLSPRAIDFTPKEGISNVKITVEGINLTADTKVLWNNIPVTPENIIAETFVEFRAPELQNEPVVEIKLVSRGDTLVLDEPFEYIIGTWTEEAELGDNGHNVRHIYFSDGDDFVYGLGVISVSLFEEVIVMDKTSLQKTFLSFPGTATEGAFYADTYFGSGSINRVPPSPTLPVSLTNEFWKYENMGFVRLADFPTKLYMAAALRSGDKLYVYGGEKENRLKNLAVYVYDIPNDTWATQSFSPFPIFNSYPAFNFGDFHYFITTYGIMHRHDYANGTWDRVADFPGTPKENGIAITLNGEVYVGQQGTDRTLYVYRPLSDTWRTKRSLPFTESYLTMGGWAGNDKIYVSRSNLNDPTIRKLWSHDPKGF